MEHEGRQSDERGERRPYVEPDLVVEGRLEELTMIPPFLLEAYG